MNTWQARLLNEFQRDFPLAPQPYEVLAARLDVAVEALLAELKHQVALGAISRVGAVVRSNVVGSSTLAALAVPEARLAEVAWRVSQFPEVNHNYLREHRYNLWFVVTAPGRAEVTTVLARIAASTQLTPISLPMLAEYHIDLGFDLQGDQPKRVEQRQVPPRTLTPAAQNVLAGLARGLPLQPSPYAALGAMLGLAEAEVIRLAEELLAEGVIKRLGIVVRHHELGFNANAMAVWDLPDTEVARFGMTLARAPGVHLCYRRTRWLPEWPYNLFCMLHGTARESVLARLADLNQELALSRYPQAVLFSVRRYKQCGARYFAAA